MDNKHLVWQDHTVHWPLDNTVYYDTAQQIDKLDELKAIFHCSEIYFHVNDNTKPAKIMFYANTQQLVSVNGHIEIFYPKYIAKVNMHINGEKRGFTEEDNIWH